MYCLLCVDINRIVLLSLPYPTPGSRDTCSRYFGIWKLKIENWKSIWFSIFNFQFLVMECRKIKYWTNFQFSFQFLIFNYLSCILKRFYGQYLISNSIFDYWLSKILNERLGTRMYLPIRCNNFTITLWKFQYSN